MAGPSRGTLNWDVPLNAELARVDSTSQARDTSLSSRISANAVAISQVTSGAFSAWTAETESFSKTGPKEITIANIDLTADYEQYRALLINGSEVQNVFSSEYNGTNTVVTTVNAIETTTITTLMKGILVSASPSFEVAEPVLSGPTSANERESVDITIVDYSAYSGDPTVDYVVDIGGFGSYSVTNEVITWTLGTIETPLEYKTILVSRRVRGLIESRSSLILEVIDVPVQGFTISINDADGWDVAPVGGDISAPATSVGVNNTSLFVNAKMSVIQNSGSLTVLGTTTSTSLVTSEEVVEGNGIVTDQGEVVAGPVTGSGPYTTDISSGGFLSPPSVAYIKKDDLSILLGSGIEDEYIGPELSLFWGSGSTSETIVLTSLIPISTYLFISGGQHNNISIDGSIYDISSVVQTGSSSVSETQPLGDSSCLATYRFNGTGESLGPNGNTISSGIDEYIDIKYSAGAVINNSNTGLGVSINVDNFAISWFFNNGRPETSTNDTALSIGSSLGDLYGVLNGTDFYFNGSAVGTVPVGNQAAFTEDATHHILMTGTSAGGLKVYLDGVEIFSNSSYTPVGVKDLFALGSGTSPGNMSYSQLRIFNRLLSPTEVLTLFDEGEYTTTVTLASPLGFTPTGSEPVSIPNRCNIDATPYEYTLNGTTLSVTTSTVDYPPSSYRTAMSVSGDGFLFKTGMISGLEAI